MAERPVAEGLVDLEQGRPRLVAGRCGACGRVHFPAGDGCPWCGSPATERTTVGPLGRLWLWTSVATRPPGYRGPLPYGFGVVQLDDVPLRLVTRLTAADPTRLRAGQRMRLVLDPVGADDDGVTLQAWAFEPLEEP